MLPNHSLPDPGPDSRFDSGFEASALPEQDLRLSRWMGWRLRLLVGAALLGCVGVFFMARWLAELPRLDAQWHPGPKGQVVLVSSEIPVLKALEGHALIGVAGSGPDITPVDALALQRSARWLIGDAERERHRALHDRLSEAIRLPSLQLVFAEGQRVELALPPRGFGGLGAAFWLLSGLALVLYLLAMVVALARPSMRTLLYALMAICQSANLVFIAVESTPELGLPLAFADWDMPLRMAFDLTTAAAAVHAASHYPLRLPGARLIALGGWVVAGALVLLAASANLSNLWWWTQGGVIVLCLLAIGLLSWSCRIEPHPFAIILRRMGIMALGTWILLTFSLAMADRLPDAQHNLAAVASTVWYVFLATLLMLVPFLTRSQQIMREFSLLAAVSTVATSLDLLFVAVFSLGQFASLTLALFLALGAYAGARQLILNQLLGSNMLTTERMFAQLYRIAREVETHPERAQALLSQLLRELFEPMQVELVDARPKRARVTGDGSSLLVPVPALSGVRDGQPGGIMIRFAHRGRRLFTDDDARLTDRIVEQLRRAVAFDKAVEQGRSEERLRLAQDLHDDIGARLLTLMYKAQSPEMEEYVRHTLKDLKTLTRGLAAPSHRLSHAAAEWKTDLSQRLMAAQVDLDWDFSFDRDIVLSVVQWSALTRVLRELISNAIAHANAQRVQVDFHLEADRLDLVVTDDGVGRNPREWSHGLGLGGVRKRVKQLGGEVEWGEAAPSGIRCRVCIRALSDGR